MSAFSEFNVNGIAVGDIIEIEQAWEDEAGNFHDDRAEVVSVAEDGRLTLKFDREDITAFLADADHFANDYEPEPRGEPVAREDCMARQRTPRNPNTPHGPQCRYVQVGPATLEHPDGEWEWACVVPCPHGDAKMDRLIAARDRK